MRKCCFCKKDLKPSDANHVYACGRANGVFDKKEVKFKHISFNFPEISKRETLKKEYENLKSLPDLREIYGLDFKGLLFLLDYFEIKKRTSSESSILISGDKFKKTCLERYGDENICGKNSPILLKRNKTIKDRYGVDNPYQMESVKEKIFGDQLYIEKYNLTRSELFSKRGKEVWSKLTDEQKTQWLDRSIRSEKSYNNKSKNHYSGYTVSKLETRIQECLNEMVISYDSQYYLKISNKKRYFFDFLIKDTNLILEINGDYWHCNPELYSPNDVVNYSFGKFVAKEIWEKDANKRRAAEAKGFVVLYIWENDIKKSNKEELKLLITNKINEYGSSKIKIS